MDFHSRLNFLEELFLNTASTYVWCFSKSFELEYSSCPVETPLKNVFMLSPCYEFMQDYFSGHRLPIFLEDDLSLLWAAVPKLVDGTLENVYLLGPVFSLHTSEEFVKKKMDIQNMSVKSQKTLLDLLRQLPILPTTFFSFYVCMLYYTLNDRCIQHSNIQFQTQPKSVESKPDTLHAKHSSYYFEKMLLKNIEEGNLNQDFFSLITSTQVGTMCPGDPLRQAKDGAIACATLFTRAAIRGGCATETAYNLSDQYLQTVEASETITQVWQIVGAMYLDFVRRVNEIKRQSIGSTLVRDCMAYIDGHLTQPIDLDILARDLGYSKYYLTSRFRKESGMTLNEYIQMRRIDYAKTMLENPYTGIQEISEALLFSTPSYFTSVFRKIIGLTPTEYRKTLTSKRLSS